MSEHRGGPHDGPRNDKHRGHRPHTPPYFEPDYDHPLQHGHEPPDNPRYPDPRIYGSYASKRPPRYVPHPFEHQALLSPEARFVRPRLARAASPPIPGATD
jgi:hypothetical protein